VEKPAQNVACRREQSGFITDHFISAGGAVGTLCVCLYVRSPDNNILTNDL